MKKCGTIYRLSFKLSIGPVLGAVIGLLFLGFVYVVYRAGTKKRFMRDTIRIFFYDNKYALRELITTGLFETEKN